MGSGEDGDDGEGVGGGGDESGVEVGGMGDESVEVGGEGDESDVEVGGGGVDDVEDEYVHVEMVVSVLRVHRVYAEVVV